MNYLEKLKTSAKKFNSIVSMGLDPVIEDIPVSTGSIKEKIICFYEEILNRIIQANEYPGAVKPNYAFYAQYGMDGIEALVYLIKLYKSNEIPVILDSKRGDIAKTAHAYAKETFDFFNADAVTLAPYMGYDSISPFTDNYPEKGFYILNKTSNKSSADFQDKLIGGKPLFAEVSDKIVEWYKPGLGAVVGATYPDQLKYISDIYIKSGKEISLLIPGIGSQGGDIGGTMQILMQYPDINIHRINSSSEINYAYKKTGTDYGSAAVEALKLLNGKINTIINQK
jgi:orotidine-5'-phosphate decarboxylase